jgi:hypothetical protein
LLLDVLAGVQVLVRSPSRHRAGVVAEASRSPCAKPLLAALAAHAPREHALVVSVIDQGRARGETAPVVVARAQGVIAGVVIRSLARASGAATRAYLDALVNLLAFLRRTDSPQCDRLLHGAVVPDTRLRGPEAEAAVEAVERATVAIIESGALARGGPPDRGEADQTLARRVVPEIDAAFAEGPASETSSEPAAGLGERGVALLQHIRGLPSGDRAAVVRHLMGA